MAERAKKKKQLTYKGKPIYRKGNRIYYGNLEDDLILVIDIVESKKSKDITITKKAVFYIQDNTGELGEGAVYRKGERESLYKAFFIHKNRSLYLVSKSFCSYILLLTVPFPLSYCFFLQIWSSLRVKAAYCKALQGRKYAHTQAFYSLHQVLKAF